MFIEKKSIHKSFLFHFMFNLKIQTSFLLHSIRFNFELFDKVRPTLNIIPKTKINIFAG